MTTTQPQSRKSKRLEARQAVSIARKQARARMFGKTLAGGILAPLIVAVPLSASAFAVPDYKQTQPADMSNVDLSDDSTLHDFVRHITQFLPASYANKSSSGWDRELWKLVSADKPTTTDDVFLQQQSRGSIFEVMANDNAGLKLQNNFDYDIKAQEVIIEDESLQAINPLNGKALSIGESVKIPGKGTITVTPPTGTDSISPVQRAGGGRLVDAWNKDNRPLIAFTPEKDFLGSIEIDYRWKQIPYGEPTEDLDSFWTDYDTNQNGSELVGKGTIKVNYVKPNMMKDKMYVANGSRAKALNKAAETPLPDKYNAASSLYLKEPGAGSGGDYFTQAFGNNDSTKVESGQSKTVNVLANDYHSRKTSTNPNAGHHIWNGTAEVGFLDSDGKVVRELKVKGQGEWITVIEPLNGKEWAHAIFIPEDGYEKSAETTWVNKTSPAFANGVKITSGAGDGTEFEYDASTLKLVNDNGDLVDTLKEKGLGVWEVKNGKLEFTADEGVDETTKSSVKYSALDTWVGTSDDKKSDLYPYTLHPYGSETIAKATISVEPAAVVEPPVVEPPVVEPPVVEPPVVEPPVVEPPVVQPPVVEPPIVDPPEKVDPPKKVNPPKKETPPEKVDPPKKRIIDEEPSEPVTNTGGESSIPAGGIMSVLFGSLLALFAFGRKKEIADKK